MFYMYMRLPVGKRALARRVAQVGWIKYSSCRVVVEGDNFSKVQIDSLYAKVTISIYPLVRYEKMSANGRWTATGLAVQHGEACAHTFLHSQFQTCETGYKPSLAPAYWRDIPANSF